MEMYEQYGVSIFYKFEPKDVYQNWTGVGDDAWGELSQSIRDYTVAYTYYYMEDAYQGMDTTGGYHFDYDGRYFNFNETQDTIFTYSSLYGPSDTLTLTGWLYYGTMVDDNGLTTTVLVDSNLYGEPTTMTYTYQRYYYNDNSFLVECADTSEGGRFIKAQLDILENMLFAGYSQEMLAENMPPRIMLGKNLQVGNSTEGIVPQSYYRANYSIILSHGDTSILALDGDGYWDLKNGLNVWFLADGMADAIYEDIAATTEFFSYSDYASFAGTYATNGRNQNTYITEWGLCLYGFSSADGSNMGMPESRFTLEQKRRLDLRSFVAMAISFPKEYLEAPVGPAVVSGTSVTAVHVLDNPIGRLSTVNGQDLSGKIRAKYDIVVNYLNSLGVDVDAIANAYWDQQTQYEIPTPDEGE